MKERPILFSPPMVRAILAGSKSQTRRIVKPQPVFHGEWGTQGYEWKDKAFTHSEFLSTIIRFSPYGQPGDRLIVAMEIPLITLEIADVRMERLQDISDSDSIAEGIERIGGDYSCSPWRNYRIGKSGEMQQHCSCPQRSYMTLWESINGPGSWGANPWVWVVEFRRIDAQP
jgi:hypothetical protein